MSYPTDVWLSPRPSGVFYWLVKADFLFYKNIVDWLLNTAIIEN